MQGFPKWFLSLAFFNVAAALLSVFFLFGDIRVLRPEDGGKTTLLPYVAEQMLWLLPVLSFFAGLKLYDYEKKAAAYAVVLGGTALTVADVIILLL